MRLCSYAIGVLISVVSLATGCASTAGTPVAATGSEPPTSLTTTSAQATTSQVAPAAPTGAPVGTAVMAVRGGDAQVTIRYRINEGPEQTETNVILPWEKPFDVYDKLETEVSADGGDTELTCTIIFDGDQLVSFVTEPRPTCSFAYWG